MIHYEDACFNCGSDCNGYCSLRDKQYKILICDKCGKEVRELYDVDGDMVCEECLLDMFDTVEGTCEDCGDETTLYEVDGKQLCEECLRDYIPMLTEEDM